MGDQVTVKIIKFPGITKLDMPPDDILDAAKDRLDGVVIMGFTKDGKEYFASSYADGGMAIWLAERMRHKLMKIVDEWSET